MSKALDLAGKKFNRLLAIERVYDRPLKTHSAIWKCLCDCGNITYVPASKLCSGEIKSCGCLARETSSRTLKSLSKEERIRRATHHGMTKTRLYSIWSHMKERCYKSNTPSFYLYGMRGINVCDEWLHSFEAFRDWAISNGYADSLTLDRIDCNGNYCPDNCRWISMFEQQHNKRNNVMITYNGETKCTSEWEREFGIRRGTAKARIQKGWDPVLAITTPVRKWSRKEHI